MLLLLTRSVKPRMDDDEMQGVGELEDQVPAQQEPERPPQPPRAHLNALGDFLALLQRQRLGRRVRRFADEAPPSHESLIVSLREQQLISTPRLLQALSMVKRGDFVPPMHQREAFLDSPIRVHDHEFNISAPHIHAKALDALEVQEGESFLDVGTGTGLMAVYASILVGKSGSVLSKDTKAVCISLSKGFLAGLKDKCEEYCQTACEVQFEQGDIFIPRHVDDNERFDKIYIGAGCPTDRLFYLTKMLKRGGSMVAPSDSELLLIKKRPCGGFTRTFLSSVNFTPLSVPSDESVISAILEVEARRVRHIPIQSSTLQSDLENALAAAQQCNTSIPPRPISPQLCQAGRRAESFTPAEAAPLKRHKSEVHLSTPPAPIPPSTVKKSLTHPWLLSIAALKLGQPDFILDHRGVHYPAHKLLLKARSKCFDALFSSGMRDSSSATYTVQENFSPSSIIYFLQWVYTDQFMSSGSDATEAAADVTHEMIDLAMSATYFGATRLSNLCETKLVQLLNQASESDALNLAPVLLKTSSSLGLRSLEANVLEFIVDHHEEMAGSGGWDDLDKDEVMLVNRHLSRRLQTMRRAMRMAAEMRQEMPHGGGGDEGARNDE